MRKIHGLITFAVIFALDLALKTIVIHSNTTRFKGGIGIGALIGERDITAFLTSYPLAIKNVGLMTLTGFLFFIYFILTMLSPRTLNRLHFSLSVFLAGLSANSFDTTLHSGVTSILLFGSEDNIRYHMNLADLMTGVGFAMFFYQFYKAIPILFPRQSYKRSYWINPQFQTRYSLIMCGMGMCFALIIGLFSYSFINAIIFISKESREPISKDWLFLYFSCFVSITLLYLTVLIAFVRRITHSVAGPVYIFEKTMRDLLAGKEAKIKLREDDEFQNLGPLADDLGKALSNPKRRPE